jgi:hypothetical protein
MLVPRSPLMAPQHADRDLDHHDNDKDNHHQQQHHHGE